MLTDAHRMKPQNLEASQTVTIPPVGSVGFYLPEIAHTDTVLVKATFRNLGTAQVQWSLNRNGETVLLITRGKVDKHRPSASWKRATMSSGRLYRPGGRTYSHFAGQVYPSRHIIQAAGNRATDAIVSVIPETSELTA